ncbi:LBF_2127 family putative lipoprotein [Leptospira limi]|uniref:LBF_2127 family putative lipoprotein n=1 Tax=Leptospira limi TaxID=2950023 RepID=UPI003898D5FC
MNLNKSSYFLIIFFLFSCNLDIRQLPTPIQNSEIENKETKINLYIRIFRIENNLLNEIQPAWKYTFTSYLKNDYFISNNIKFSDLNNENKDFYEIDILMKPIANEVRNYWLSLPVIFPFTGYWPIHYRELEYFIDIHYSVYKNNNLIYSNNIFEKDNLTLYFYGLIRTQKFENLIEDTNLRAINSCVKSISSFLSQL